MVIRTVTKQKWATDGRPYGVGWTFDMAKDNKKEDGHMSVFFFLFHQPKLWRISMNSSPVMVSFS